ncbi:glycosyltransferase family 2 protein [Kaistella jeonii]|uniref:Capsular biosynthesis protein CpsI n=1 Tax=Kaistella jeonii TaxID=266749 RepID=A0A0C1D8P6_9FLAO|nr:glycosyltransferase family 2 protein [Kaistella jeonii]KIA90235.1 capsular biosynthesis protein CpsI [Kaistella jeonii]SFB80831.1 Glycosyltransferase involved in cell wall bisynthesis [Kaistella jeonii]VEI96183.1 Hyaluronan synthase [Kaistella jeonii]
MLNISVIIPVYNAAAFLKKAVESALQFEEVKEIILIDDCSTDDSLKVCQELTSEYSRVHLFQHVDKGNHGAGASRNLGLEKASQEFIAFLDADDYYLPNRFDSEKEIFKNKKIEGVFGAIGTEFLSEKGKEEFIEKFKNTELTTVKKTAEGKEIFYGLLGLEQDFGTFFSLISLTVRNESLHKNNLKFNENLRIHQDSDFIIKLSFHCFLKTGSITEAVSIRGVHDDNRITKIKIYSEKYNQRQFLLWNSIYNWAKNKNIEKKYLEHIQLSKKSFELSIKKGLSKYLNLAYFILQNPKILKTRYRFTFLKR